MIVKRQFTPVSMWPYARMEILLGAVCSLAAWLLVDVAGLDGFALPVTLATVLGTALSILLAVRANTAYQRWWEASGIWAQIVGMSRTLVRVAVTVSDSKRMDPELTRVFQRDIARRQIAYVTALRAQLRGTDHADLGEHLDADDEAALAGVDNKAYLLMSRQSARIFQAYGDGLLSGFDNFQMEGALAGLSNQQALAERIAMQPVPRTYDVFSRYLVHLYTVVFPFAIIGSLARYRWLVIPATLIVAFAFRMVERIGSVVEAPFGNTTQDVPLTAIGVLLDRDLLELLADPDRPDAPAPTNGYLW